MEIKDLQKIMQDNGVVGAGGAGFPSYAKLTDKADTILMNCAECEPLLKLHRQLLERHAYEIMKTFHTVMETVGASQAIIGIKRSYVQTIKALQQHIEEFPGLKLHLLDEVYPMGDEVVLIYEATGRVCRFVLIEHLQADIGCLASCICRYKGCRQPEYFQNSYSFCHFASPLFPDHLLMIAILRPVIARLVL